MQKNQIVLLHRNHALLRRPGASPPILMEHTIGHEATPVVLNLVMSRGSKT